MELLAAIAILATLAALLFPMAGKFMESANASKCISNMKHIGHGAAALIADNDGRLPDRLDTLYNSQTKVAANQRAVQAYIYPTEKDRPSNGGVFHCPCANPRKASSLGASWEEKYPGLSYGINFATTDRTDLSNPVKYKLSQILQPSKRALAIESNTWNISTAPGDIANRFAPRHRGTPTANNPSGEAATILFIDGHVEMRVMSMNPIDQAEWKELGVNGANENMTK